MLMTICRNCCLARRDIVKEFSKLNHYCAKNYSSKKWRVLFFGSDDNSFTSLKSMNTELKTGKTLETLHIVTANSSRLLKVIEDYVEKENIQHLQWPLDNFKSGTYDIGVVVSFGHMIPESVIDSFPLGMVVVHPSLLPRWRGGMPIHHALLHGDKQTGVTVMRIKPKKFDIGEIVSQKVIEITDNMRLPELSNKIIEASSTQLIEFLRGLPDNLANAKPQNDADATYAPKIKKSLCNINWEQMSARGVYNLYRATYSVFDLTTSYLKKEVKLFDAFIPPSESLGEPNTPAKPPGTIVLDKKLSGIKIYCADGNCVYFRNARVVGKRKVSATEFYNSYVFKSDIKIFEHLELDK